ncbi:alpha/beta hydrolase [Sphingopyxis sp. MWB1]|uniref:alpha/beta hydrolase n=1 Tax=Sphingopyxis sp. MWB1 TaxID=1537715 RepID=UPI001364713B|nr:lipase family protein [Sphingopyxis sp. MWB1]
MLQAREVPASVSTPTEEKADCSVKRDIPPQASVGQILCAEFLPRNSEARLTKADYNYLIQYVSEDVNRQKIAVTATLAVPQRAAAVPIIAWAHGTVGAAPHCAPSLNGIRYSERRYVSLMRDTLNRWVERGYAVVQSDYQGLGIAPQEQKASDLHPYLIGEVAAKNVIDAVRATRRLSPHRYTQQWLVMGHSQGGQTSVYVAEMAQDYAPEYDLVGAVAIAPAAYLSEQTEEALANPESQVSAFGALMMKGVEVVDPTVDIPPLLSEEGKKRYALVDERCVSGLRQADGWSGNLGDLIDADVEDFRPMIDAMIRYQDPENREPNVPLIVIQAPNDQATLERYSRRMVDKFRAEGRAVDWQLIEGLEDVYPHTVHQLTVPESFDEAFTWVSQRLPPPRP